MAEIKKRTQKKTLAGRINPKDLKSSVKDHSEYINEKMAEESAESISIPVETKQIKQETVEEIKEKEKVISKVIPMHYQQSPVVPASIFKSLHFEAKLHALKSDKTLLALINEYIYQGLKKDKVI